MTREEFVKQRCEIDKITEEEFEEQYRVVKCNCGKPYCNGYRCLDLDDLLKETQELKKQLEETDRKLFFIRNELDMREKTINNKLIQQKEFINYLEKEIKRINPNDLDISELNLRLDDIKFIQYLIYKEILQKYKEIIGDDK